MQSNSGILTQSILCLHLHFPTNAPAFVRLTPPRPPLTLRRSGATATAVAGDCARCSFCGGVGGSESSFQAPHAAAVAAASRNPFQHRQLPSPPSVAAGVALGTVVGAIPAPAASTYTAHLHHHTHHHLIHHQYLCPFLRPSLLRYLSAFSHLALQKVSPMIAHGLDT